MIILNIYIGEKKKEVEFLSPTKINETNLIEYPLNISTNSSEISIFDDISKRYNQNTNDIIIKDVIHYSSSYMKSKRFPSYCIYYCF